MTAFSEIVFSFGGIALRVWSVLLVIVQLYVMIDVFIQRRRWKTYLPAAVQLLLGLGWFFILLDGSYYVDWVEAPRVYPSLVNLIYTSPWLAVAGIELLLTLIAVFSFWSLLRYQRRHLSRGVIKETLDMLPVGICFSKEDGTVVLKNLQMDRWCAVLTGSPLFDAQTFWQKVEAIGEAQNKARIVLLSDEAAVLFLCEKIMANGMPYTQITAFDVSEQYRITAQLKANNKKLIDLQTRIKAYSAMTAQLAMTEEILRARVTVHDEMGYLLLSGKYYLDHTDSADAENLLELERYTHRLLMREGEEPDDAMHDGYHEAMEIARAIGVRVIVTGEAPQNDSVRGLLGRVIRECAANTVKHACGSSLYLTLTREGDCLIAVFRGDGEAPDAPITESGGLLNLRRMIESAGGEMQITCDPQVTVRITLNCM